MTREQAEAMACKFLPKPISSIAMARLADAFEAAYDDGVRDESLRWAAGQKTGLKFDVNLPPEPCPIDWCFVPPASTWEFKKR